MSEVKYSKENLYSENVHIYTESSPNPNSMKFVLNFILIQDGDSFDFPSIESATSSPLATELFSFPYVNRVFFMNNFITLTKDDSVEWDEANPKIREFIKNFFLAKKPIFNETQPEQEVIINNDSEAVKKIKGVLDEYIKPAVEMDGGAIQFHSFDAQEGILKVHLQGSCSGCPSSTVTLKAGIQNLMQRMVPEVKDVIAEGI